MDIQLINPIHGHPLHPPWFLRLSRLHIRAKGLAKKNTMVNFRNHRNPLYFILVTVYSVVKLQLHPQVEAARDEGAWYEAIKGDLVKA